MFGGTSSSGPVAGGALYDSGLRQLDLDRHRQRALGAERRRFPQLLLTGEPGLVVEVCGQVPRLVSGVPTTSRPPGCWVRRTASPIDLRTRPPPALSQGSAHPPHQLAVHARNIGSAAEPLKRLTGLPGAPDRTRGAHPSGLGLAVQLGQDVAAEDLDPLAPGCGRRCAGRPGRSRGRRTAGSRRGARRGRREMTIRPSKSSGRTSSAIAAKSCGERMSALGNFMPPLGHSVIALASASSSVVGPRQVQLQHLRHRVRVLAGLAGALGELVEQPADLLQRRARR